MQKSRRKLKMEKKTGARSRRIAQKSRKIAQNGHEIFVCYKIPDNWDFDRIAYWAG